MSPAFFRLSVFALGLLATACTATPDGAPVEPVATATTVVKAAPPPPTPKPEPPLPTLASLFDASPAALNGLLGAPSLKRIEPPAELWQYRGTSCVLALYLYEKPKGGAHALTHAEAHDGRGKRVETETCLHALLREKS